MVVLVDCVAAGSDDVIAIVEVDVELGLGFCQALIPVVGISDSLANSHSALPGFGGSCRALSVRIIAISVVDFEGLWLFEHLLGFSKECHACEKGCDSLHNPFRFCKIIIRFPNTSHLNASV